MTITEIPFLSEHRVDKIKKELGAPGSLNNLFLRACFALAII